VGRFEILEHTADVGVRAWGADLPETFEMATRGLADISGTWAPGAGDPVDIEVRADDVEAALVDWLNEALWLQDSRDAVITRIEVDAVTEGGAAGRLWLAPRDRELDGTAVKAVTYHQLDVSPDPAGWVAQVYVDV
jgi:SHS2 domain-containing protein